MKALTICQPYAHLIAIGHKRVENRTWPTRYRGPLAIHAGKSRKFLGATGNQFLTFGEPNYGIALADMAFGAVVATCRLAACVRIEDAPGHRFFPWLESHEHTEGPWCWVLTEIQPIKPFRCSGAQGLWDWDNDSANPPPERRSTRPPC